MHVANAVNACGVQETVLHSETRHGEKVKITVTLTNELPPTSPVCLQFYNIIFRRSGWSLRVRAGHS